MFKNWRIFDLDLEIDVSPYRIVFVWLLSEWIMCLIRQIID